MKLLLYLALIFQVRHKLVSRNTSLWAIVWARDRKVVAFRPVLLFDFLECRYILSMIAIVAVVHAKRAEKFLVLLKKSPLHTFATLAALHARVSTFPEMIR